MAAMGTDRLTVPVTPARGGWLVGASAPGRRACRSVVTRAPYLPTGRSVGRSGHTATRDPACDFVYAVGGAELSDWRAATVSSLNWDGGVQDFPEPESSVHNTQRREQGRRGWRDRSEFKNRTEQNKN